MGCDHVERPCIVLVFFCSLVVVGSVTNPNDFRVLNDFRNGLDNPELLKWPSKGNDPCGPPLWPHVFCSSGRVTQIQVRGLGLKGHLPRNLNQLSKLQNVGLQGNQFSGNLPSFSGLSELQFAYLDDNQFDSIPSDFFHGLSSVRVLALDKNPFNATTGWSIPDELQESVNLANFSCSGCNLVGPLPEFLGRLSSLTALRLSYNNISGDLPSSFHGSLLQFLWLNNQAGGGLTGSIDVIGSMTGLTQLWLHGNSFTGTIPDSIRDLTSLKQLNLNGNKLVGPIPPGLANLNLDVLDLNNNMLMGPIPKFKASNATYSSNSFCQPDPGDQCAPEVSALLDFLQAVSFPPFLASKWTGNDPCKGSWWGITCNPKSQVSIINLQKMNLNGTLSPSLVNLGSLLEIHLGGNNLTGLIPSNLTQLSSLRILDLSGNNFSPPLPKFRDGVKVITDDNPQLSGDPTKGNSPLSPPNNSPSSPTDQSGGTPRGQASDGSQGSKGSDSNSRSFSKEQSDKKLKNILVIAVASASAILIILAVLYAVFFFKKRKYSRNGPVGGAMHPRHPYGPDKLLKVVVAKNSPGSTPRGVSENRLNNGMENAHVPEDGDFTISVKVLRSVTNNFAAENELGRGGFGAVYKGEFDDGTKVAVKRMESGVITSKGLDEFQAEIAVLSKVRHRHLVSLLGYSIEENEKLLVYEYMPQGALSMHLFHWKALTLEPLSWTKRLIIALDVARGMEYLHNLAHQSFIHRDLKSSNILLGDDFRAKIADFGLVKLAPDRERSVATRLAGTFGYLAPEYAVTGKITTKADVFSFGVVLMELVTGLVALDEHRSEESRYLAEWFWQIKSNKEKLISAIDPTLDTEEEILDSICTIAELAGHCTSRDPNHRPDMGHAVNVLVSLVEKWTPFKEETEDESEMNMLPLPQMLKDWKEESADYSGISLQDSKGSIPARPTGLAESFTSSDAR